MGALARAGYGSVTELEALEFGDFLRYNVSYLHDLDEQRRALASRRK